MINEEFKKIIEENPVALATVTDEAKPNVIGVAYAKVIDSDKIVITDNYMNKTAQDIKRNPSVCLVVWDKSWKGCKIIGSAEYYDSGKWFDFVKDMPENADCPAKGAVLVNIEKFIELH